MPRGTWRSRAAHVREDTAKPPALWWGYSDTTSHHCLRADLHFNPTSRVQNPVVGGVCVNHQYLETTWEIDSFIHPVQTGQHTPLQATARDAGGAQAWSVCSDREASAELNDPTVDF
ncbi:hypothetical protein H8959_009508 [Pygathrix nigripes]